MGVKNDNVKWVDGLRGIASFLVVVTHIARVSDEELFFPADSDQASPRVLQWPLIRVLFQGRIGVAIFSMVTGYVCALKPIRLAKAGNTEGALITVAKSAFRRVPRLVLPTTIVSVIAWVLTQFGVFQVARHADNRWLAATAPEVLPNLSDSVWSFGYNLITTWTQGLNSYDPNQWTLHQLLKASMLVYVTVCATIYLQPRYRMFVSLGLCVYYYVAGDSAFGMTFSFGLFLADFQNRHPSHSPPTNPPWIVSTFVSPLLLILGLFMASFPEGHPEWSLWSRFLDAIGCYLVPAGQDIPRYYTSFGLQFIAFGIHFSPRTKDVLSHPLLLWLGKQSFAIYLIHGCLMRSILTWMLYGTKLPDLVMNENNEWVSGPSLKIVGSMWRAIWVPIWFVLLYVAATGWTNYVDPMCARWTASLEKYVALESEKADHILVK